MKISTETLFHVYLVMTGALLAFASVAAAVIAQMVL